MGVWSWLLYRSPLEFDGPLRHPPHTSGSNELLDAAANRTHWGTRTNSGLVRRDRALHPDLRNAFGGDSSRRGDSKVVEVCGRERSLRSLLCCASRSFSAALMPHVKLAETIGTDKSLSRQQCDKGRRQTMLLCLDVCRVARAHSRAMTQRAKIANPKLGNSNLRDIDLTRTPDLSVPRNSVREANFPSNDDKPFLRKFRRSSSG